jgi:glucokinase
VGEPQFEGLTEAIAAFLPSPRPTLEAAGFGVAGPVLRGVVRTTNLPWVVDQSELWRFLGTPHIRILNDLEAMAWGIELLEEKDFLPLQDGVVDPDGGAALIAAGTGLGQALLPRIDGRFHPSPTEGGHASFSPIDDEMDAFLAWMRARSPHGHVSAERAVSGIGLHGMYTFFHDPARGGSVPHLTEGPGLNAALSASAKNGSCDGCVRALGLFVRCYGVEAGNLALKAGATAGLYIGGGIAGKNLDAMKDGRFIAAFRAKGRFEEYLSRIPVQVILNEATPLLGAALAAARAAGRMA